MHRIGQAAPAVDSLTTVHQGAGSETGENERALREPAGTQATFCSLVHYGGLLQKSSIL